MQNYNHAHSWILKKNKAITISMTTIKTFGVKNIIVKILRLFSQFTISSETNFQFISKLDSNIHSKYLFIFFYDTCYMHRVTPSHRPTLAWIIYPSAQVIPNSNDHHTFGTCSTRASSRHSSQPRSSIASIGMPYASVTYVKLLM